ncbi:hypothetical protein [Pseudoalteromonas ostreae]|uniref:hypothetical protein n=1 Tax=Pseudoalteromonas ostreae TaxID=2774154 RepID=UPI001B38D1BE|nr:hypothetical protein [Pseudoalteromonas ostreae]
MKSGPAYKNTKGFVLQGVTRRDIAFAKDYAKRHNVHRVFKTADELIASSDIDACISQRLQIAIWRWR